MNTRRKHQRPQPYRDLVMPERDMARATEAELRAHLRHVINGRGPWPISERVHEAKRTREALDRVRRRCAYATPVRKKPTPDRPRQRELSDQTVRSAPTAVLLAHLQHLAAADLPAGRKRRAREMHNIRAELARRREALDGAPPDRAELPKSPDRDP